PLDDVRVRRAINYAVDKDALLATVAKGIALKAFAPLTAVMLDDPALRQAYPFDAAKAGALLAEAGWQPGSDGIRTKGGQRLEIILNAIDYGGGPEPAVQLIQSSLHEVGVEVKLKTQARPPWYEDNYRCATHGPVMFLRSIDPDGLFALFHSSMVGGNFNWSCVKNAKLHQMLEQGRREFDPAKRRALYLAIEKLAVDEALTVPLLDDPPVAPRRADVPHPAAAGRGPRAIRGDSRRLQHAVPGPRRPGQDHARRVRHHAGSGRPDAGAAPSRRADPEAVRTLRGQRRA